jgi:hypothetical protein
MPRQVRAIKSTPFNRWLTIGAGFVRSGVTGRRTGSLGFKLKPAFTALRQFEGLWREGLGAAPATVLKLGVDIIKIDKMFIDAIGTDRNSNTIIETLIESCAEHAHGNHRRGRREFRAGRAAARTRRARRAGLCVRAAAAGSAFLQLVEAIDPLKSAAGPPAMDAPAEPLAGGRVNVA